MLQEVDVKPAVARSLVKCHKRLKAGRACNQDDEDRVRNSTLNVTSGVKINHVFDQDIRYTVRDKFDLTGMGIGTVHRVRV